MLLYTVKLIRYYCTLYAQCVVISMSTVGTHTLRCANLRLGLLLTVMTSSLLPLPFYNSGRTEMTILQIKYTGGNSIRLSWDHMIGFKLFTVQKEATVLSVYYNILPVVWRGIWNMSSTFIFGYLNNKRVWMENNWNSLNVIRNAFE